MKGNSLVSGVLIGVFGLFLSPVLRAQENQESQDSTEEKEAAQPAEDQQSSKSKRPRVVLGKPSARRGAPVRSVGGGSRGVTGDWPYLYVLAPPEVGLTTQEQPSLFWYLSDPTGRSFLLTLSRVEKIPETILEVKLKQLEGHGISRMDLSALAVKLRAGVDYIWTIALEVDPESPSKNITSSTIIRREDLPAADQQSSLAAQVAPVDSDRWQDVDEGLQLAQVYAGSGYFLDALAVLSNLVEAHPDDAELQELREDLLQQTGLNLSGGG